MKLAFPNGEHDDIAIGKGSISIGSSDDDDVVIKSDGVQPGHAVIIVDKRGITLSIETDDDTIRVNERPVREKAIIRMGDSLLVHEVQMLFRVDDSRIVAPPAEAALVEDDASYQSNPPKYLLRGLAGEFLGRAAAIRGRIVIGQGGGCDVVLPSDDIADEHVAIELSNAGVLLRNIGAGDSTVINGIQAADAILHPGDQLAFGSQRFMVEAPSWVPGKMFQAQPEEAEGSTTQVFSALDLSQSDGSGNADPAASKEDESETNDANSKRRDAIIISVCLGLSVFMLVWLWMNI